MPELALKVRVERSGFTLAVDTALALTGITALFGPSGSGKTSLLRIIAGLEPAAHGQLRFDGESWSADGRRPPPQQRGTPMVFQDTRLFPHLDVAGNLRYAERRADRHRPGPVRDEVIAALDLAPLLPRRVPGLSGGERQRVALARCLLARPRLLLLDEPLAALDLQRRAELLPYLEKLPVLFGIPSLYVTHAVDEVARLAEQVLVMANGRIVASGETAAVLERLDLPQLTGLPETGALLDARLRRHDPALGLSELELAGQRLSLPQVDAAPGSRLRLRVRARDVALAREPVAASSIRNQLRARVLAIEEQADGPFAEVLLALDGGDELHLRARITRASARELQLSPGQPIHALIKSVALDGEPLAQEL